MDNYIGLTPEQAANTFTNEQLEGLIHGNNPVSNLARELLARRKLDGKPFGYYSPKAATMLEHLGYMTISAAPLVDSDQPLYTTPQPLPETLDIDSIALEFAQEVMNDVNRRADFLGGDVQLLARIQCRVATACRSAINHNASDLGWAIVPRNPTYQICEALGARWESPGPFPERWKAMLKIAP